MTLLSESRVRRRPAEEAGKPRGTIQTRRGVSGALPGRSSHHPSPLIAGPVERATGPLVFSPPSSSGRRETSAAFYVWAHVPRGSPTRWPAERFSAEPHGQNRLRPTRTSRARLGSKVSAHRWPKGVPRSAWPRRDRRNHCGATAPRRHPPNSRSDGTGSTPASAPRETPHRDDGASTRRSMGPEPRSRTSRLRLRPGHNRVQHQDEPDPAGRVSRRARRAPRTPRRTRSHAAAHDRTGRRAPIRHSVRRAERLSASGASRPFRRARTRRVRQTPARSRG